MQRYFTEVTLHYLLHNLRCGKTMSTVARGFGVVSGLLETTQAHNVRVQTSTQDTLHQRKIDLCGTGGNKLQYTAG